MFDYLHRSYAQPSLPFHLLGILGIEVGLGVCHDKCCRLRSSCHRRWPDWAGDLAQREIKRFVWRTTCTAHYWDRHIGIEVRDDNPKYL